MDVTRDFTEVMKVWLAGGAVLLALGWSMFPPKLARQLLIGLVLLSGANYARWGFEAATRRLDAYDLLHYYVNAKYFDELGYLDLYPAILLVDHEHDGPFFTETPTYLAQDETGHHLEPISAGLARGKVVRERFTEERWAELEHDVLYLQRTVGCTKKNRKGKCIRELDDDLWVQLINDHGFNGTPGWVVLAKPFTVIPVEGLKFLGYLDVLLLGAAIGAVAWAYRGTAWLWTTLFLLVGYSTRWPYLSWAFLRYDWLAALIAATALLRKGYPLAGGLLAGASATSRLFPALWMWGPLCKGVAGLVRGVVHKPLLRFALGFVIAVVVLEGAAIVWFGPHTITDHFQNMLDHNSAEQLSSRRIGLALALATEPWRWTAQDPSITNTLRATIDAEEPLRYALAIAGMFAIGYAVRNRRDDEAFGFGFLSFFGITTASYYYYVARVPLIIIHAGDLGQLRNRVGLAMLFALEMFSNWAQGHYPDHRMILISVLAWGLLLYGLMIVPWTAWDGRKPEDVPAP